MAGGVPSPLALLLRQAQDPDPAAQEVVLLTFNHDLAFFERSALGVIEHTGARITVVADARVAHHDLYAVRRAGTAYLPGLAWCPGAFHPKLILVASERQATIAVGSGNLSLSGWQANDELWTVHHLHEERPSAVAATIASWFRALPGAVALSEGVPEALNRNASLLDRFSGPADNAVAVIHSLHQPILEQLPVGPVDHLALYAPFHDPGGEAVAALVERFRPERISIAVQPTLTQINGPATAEHLGPNGELITLADHPYRHGKLIEWEAEGQRWALTGSPNLSRAALLRPAVAGGNVELAVVTPIDEPLFPAGTSAPGTAVRQFPYHRRDEASKPSVVVLSAVRQGEAVAVRLARPLTEPATIEVSPAGTSPDHWRAAGGASAGEDVLLIAEDLPGGSRLRVRVQDGTLSPVVFVIDPARVLRTRAPTAAGRPPPDLHEVLTDPRAAEQLARIIGEFHLGPGRLAPARSQGGARPGGTFEVGDWEEYLERCQGRVGPATLAFALGVPMRIASPAHPSVHIDWDDETLDDDQAGGLDDDTPDQIPETEAAATAVTPALHRATEVARRRYRQVAESVIRKWQEPDPHERLLALRLALVLVAGGAWTPSDTSWGELVLDGVINLDVESPGSEYEEAAGSLAALSLSVVQSILSGTDRTATRIRFERAVNRIGYLLVAATPSRVEAYAEGLEGRFPLSSTAELVFERRDRLVNEDPIANAIEMLAEQGIDATAEGPVIDLPTPVSSPLLPAWQALAAVPEVSPLAIRSAGRQGWATVLWRVPDLVSIQAGAKPGTFQCRHYRYPAKLHPSADIRYDTQPAQSRTVATTMAGEPLPAVAAEILAAVGLDRPGLREGVGQAPGQGHG